ncbi:GtrA family protein [Saccharomonospora cyanea]|uniref:Putative membrane protein n=1 Tax=Saccharomonospora cyanea NA-134 TaxID=882082 RepID=H5XQ27_9PSEU|nr:GtrA family protein [Saccharomonospora cyanea]EHR63293.1 putative membrane protein [Saccharomonospora cyanea NA-134]
MVGMHNGGVSTATTAAEEPPTAEAGRPRLLVRLFRAATSSALATGISQVTLIGLLWWGAAPALASAVAFVAGAIPNFFLARRWAWGRKGTPPVKGELVPYLVVIGLAGLASVGLTTLAGWFTEPLELSGLLRIVVLDAVFLGSYAIVFFMKFALLDRLVFRHATRIRVAKSPS